LSSPLPGKNEKLAHFKEKTSLTILDVGAATGEFTHVARTRGHDAYGIEISKGARDAAHEHYKLDLSGTPLE
jgi:2-polyprenyl-3-methyl-5-hydroxy-6-metoxy-1,4-benzoquinol methylase